MTDFVEIDGWRYRRARVLRSRLLINTQNDTVLTVDCPLCPGVHMHGGTAGYRGDCGHKVAHCSTREPDGTNIDHRGYIVWDDRPLEAWEK